MTWVFPAGVDKTVILAALDYELQMLRAMAALCKAEILCGTPPGTPKLNAYIESFLVHARLLSEFFRKPAGNATHIPDNVRASRWFGAAWKYDTWHDSDAQKHGIALTYDAWFQLMHKCLAHLSTVRDRPNVQWPFDYFVDAIEAANAEFRKLI